MFEEKRRTIRHEGELSTASIFFAIGSVLFLSFVLFCRFDHQDNFSHWASVVKTMLLTNAFPSNDASIVFFTDYPLGSACFLYYVCSVVGSSQGVMLFAQTMCILACFYACFGIITETKRFLLYIFLAFGCSVLSYFHTTIRLNNLLVDFWMPVMSVAIIATIFRYRDDFSKACLLVSPSLAFLMLIKNSSIVFVLLAIMTLLFVAFWSKENRIKRFLMVLSSSALAIIAKISWSLHVSLSFPEAENKFSITTDAMQSIWFEKTATDIQTIIHLMGHALIDTTSRCMMGLYVFECIGIAVCLISFFGLKKRLHLQKVFPILNIVVIFYFVSILGMYLFAMPVEEALYLAAFERYASSIVVFFVMSLFVCLTIDIQNSFDIKIGDVANYKAFRSIETKKQYNNAVVGCIIATLLLLTSEYNGMIFNQNTYTETTASLVFSTLGDAWPEGGTMNEDSYLIYATDTYSQVSNYSVEHVARYALYGTEIKAICEFDDAFVSLLEQYDYFVILESTPTVQTMMAEQFGLDAQVRIYSVSELFATKALASNSNGVAQ